MKIKVDSKLLFNVLLIALYNVQIAIGDKKLNIMEFTSKKTNGTADHSQAFRDAWDKLCQEKTKDIPTLYIPQNETIMLHSIELSGPCMNQDMRIQIDGKIEAPKKVEDWPEHNREFLLGFMNVRGLHINGSGLIDSHGEVWWNKIHHSGRPTTVRFTRVVNMVYDGLTQMNSAKNHISLYDCTNATVSNIHLIAPRESPNTDGIDISLSKNIHILNSSIETGDDCIAINGGSSNINISHVACGPGHGISVGSLGRGGGDETVEHVNVRNCSFNSTQNGARIKTWTGGIGFARNILFENITLINAEYPIIIDQHYCNGGHNCDYDKKTAVEVRNVTYRNFKGTCSSEIAIKLDCDEKTTCKNIEMDNINITSVSSKHNLSTFCQFAKVVSRFVSLDLNCPDSDGGEEPPAPSPEY